MTNIFENGLTAYLSPDSLSKIRSVRIGIGGAGGLGSNIAVMLCRCGFKHFEILDKDTVEASNLNRQQYLLKDIQAPKVLALKNLLLSVNPDVQVTAMQETWTKDNAEKFFTDCDIIIEAFDSPADKHAFTDYYREHTRFLVSGNGMAGFGIDRKIGIKKIDNVYFVGDNTTDINDGHPPLAPRVTMCAAMMADVVLDLTLNTL